MELPYRLHLGDCLQVLKTFPDNSFDSVVTDPPYGLSFMGKRWDYDVPSVDVWAECLRVLKPGGHLLAFAGTRTHHRMACRIEDAGFEIRDMIAWVYGSGFPKSRNLDGDWQGWGTALKPALETVTFASKPYTDEQVRDIIQSNLIRLEARLWLLSSASAAEKNSTSNPSEYGAACGIAQWSADEITSTRAVLCDQMGTSLFALATTTSLNIVSSWRRTLDESWNDGSTSTIETKSSTTIDWRTLKFSVSQITPASIIRACSLPGGFSANATTAESHFNASLSLLQSIRTLSATERAMSQAQHEHQGAGVKPNLDPCIMARKPLVGTVAANVLAHGTGALNIDACRIPTGEALRTGSGGIPCRHDEHVPRTRSGEASAERRYIETGGTNFAMKPGPRGGAVAGRWPANLIHDGSTEVVALFPADAGQAAPLATRNSDKTRNSYGTFAGSPDAHFSPHDAGGSAARFFYCAKASRKDRNEGCDELPQQRGGMVSNTSGKHITRRDGYEPPAAGNHHPTVKPTDLMAYLVRLVTPPGGKVLDPFTGSGSTGKAAVREGFEFVGIEREPPYLAIAEARIAHELERVTAAALETAEAEAQLDIFRDAKEQIA